MPPGSEFSHALLAAVVRKPEAELTSALDRLVHSGLLFKQGMPPHASYPRCSATWKTSELTLKT
jgi:hypothetical protein